MAAVLQPQTPLQSLATFVYARADQNKDALRAQL